MIKVLDDGTPEKYLKKKKIKTQIPKHRNFNLQNYQNKIAAIAEKP